MNRGTSVRSCVAVALAIGFAACSGSDGKDGKSCTIQKNDAGVNIMVCPDGTTASVGGTTTLPPVGLDGGNTPTGPQTCTISAPDGGAKMIMCPDGTHVVIPDVPTNPGTGGTTTVTSGCSVASNGDGTSTMTCPSGDGGTITVRVKNALVSFASLSADAIAALDLQVTLTSITIPATGKPMVAFRALDAAGGNLVAGLPANAMRFALLKLVPAAKGGNDTWVSYMAANATSTASTETGAATATATSGALTDNGDGTYVYNFAKNITDAANAGTTYDPAAVHRFAMQLSQTVNSVQAFAPVNVVKDFVPATGQDVTGQHDVVDGASCLECHSSFRAKAGGTSAFHGGARYDLRFCVACHNDQRRFTAVPGTGTTPRADLDATGTVDATGNWTGSATLVNGEAFINLPVFIHKIHMGEELTLKGGTYTGVSMPYETTYPQDIRNCDKCHRAPAPLAGNFASKPSRRACGSCHDGVSFAATPPAGRKIHAGGPQADDSLCTACHPVTGPKTAATVGVMDSHVAVAEPDPGASNFGGTNTHTNQGWIPAAGQLPAGAAKITYDLKSVARDASKHPSIVFRFIKDGTPVVFNTPVAGVDGGAGSGEMMDGFANSPSVYFVYALPQDGIAKPADFNGSASAWIKDIWMGSSKGTMTGPDANGYYTITLSATVPDSAVMLTGGVGYSYGTTSSQPLTQINLPAFPYGDATKVPGCVSGPCGGLIVPTANVAMVATGYTARRAIVDNGKCLKCHEQLGANPTFHAGQRNDGPTCAFCHNPNRASSGWSASSSSFIHGIHGAAERTMPFTWHAACPDGSSTCTVEEADSYAKVTYPGILKDCQQCHVAGSYDFSATASAAALPNLLMSTVAVNPSATSTLSAGVSTSPYVTPSTDYGSTFAVSGSRTTGTKNGVACTTDAPCTCTADSPCDATDNALVMSPITAACSACHDAPAYIAHMKANGGTFYGTHLDAMNQTEQCMMCHGPGGVAAVGAVHNKP
jgi:OmcA/MtrC family decaheme c-type cytochrome